MIPDFVINNQPPEAPATRPQNGLGNGQVTRPSHLPQEFRSPTPSFRPSRLPPSGGFSTNRHSRLNHPNLGRYNHYEARNRFPPNNGPCQGIRASPQQPNIVPETWVTRKSVVLRVSGVPESATPWNLKRFFDGFGNVVSVELDGECSAKLRFDPPPKDLSFHQDGRCRLVINGVTHWVEVYFPERQWSERNTLQTPLGNMCPTVVEVALSKVTLGLLTEPTTFMGKKEISALSLNLKVDFKRMKLVVNFPLRRGQNWTHHRVDIKFGVIKGIDHMTTAESRAVLVISLLDAPVFWRKKNDIDESAWVGRLSFEEHEMWCRATNIMQDPESDQKPLSVEESGFDVDVGRWTVYWLELGKDTQDTWTQIAAHLRDWNIQTGHAKFIQTPNRDPELWPVLKEPAKMLQAPSWQQDLSLLGSTAHVSLPFDVRYQLEVCVSRGILSEYSVGHEFFEKLMELSDPSTILHDRTNRARLILEYAADQGKRIWNPMDLLSDPAALSYYPTTLHIPNYCALVRKITVTPTRVYFSTPGVETTNRVIRRYWDAQKYFIRIQFTDELLEGRVNGSDADKNDELYARIYRALFRGVRMGVWHWQFLAFGNSQIRENGAFLFCQPEDSRDTIPSCDIIRDWMGDFKHIKVVAKYAARLGQCFSTTRLLKGIYAPLIVKIQDIDIEEGRFCFTDGVGKISPVLAGLIADEWKVCPPPSAYQFRMGGCKGVLVTWPDVKGTEVQVRPSQEKFSAAFNGLEIIRCSQFSCATLNRQTITVLSCLGVPDETFVSMMREQLAHYNAAMTDGAKAVDMLTSYVDENMTTCSIAAMIKSGFMASNEPFVRTILQLWRSWSIKALKEKARLMVDKGALVLGCADETGTLRGHVKKLEGRSKVTQDELPQIFLQVSDPKAPGDYTIITGICIVGRNPSLHPGDIRVVEAVDVPALRHIRDMVVFPITGDRDVPSMCSGGDLDGDDFFVIWDEKLVPSEWSHPPMDYTPPKPITESSSSAVENLASFFVKFMKNDRLPLIAHAHLATADHDPEGAKSRNCLDLAELHSVAVDYVKTGVPAQWNKKLDPRQWPHFMEKRKGKYHSHRALGKLYDMVKSEVFDSTKNYTLPFDDRILNRYVLGNDLLKQARKIKTQYDIGMRRILGQLEIPTEFEVWTSFVMSKPRIGTDYKVQEKVGREAAALKSQFRELCTKAAGGRHFEALGPFVAAMYQITWEELYIALFEARQEHVRPDGSVGLRRITARSMPLITFPWLFPTELCSIATAKEEVDLLGLGIAAPTKKRHSHANRNAGEEDLDFMEYSRTEDGQVLHRGEIVHFFAHDEDQDEKELNLRLEPQEESSSLDRASDPDISDTTTSSPEKKVNGLIASLEGDTMVNVNRRGQQDLLSSSPVKAKFQDFCPNPTKMPTPEKVDVTPQKQTGEIYSGLHSTRTNVDLMDLSPHLPAGKTNRSSSADASVFETADGQYDVTEELDSESVYEVEEVVLVQEGETVLERTARLLG
ncbi:putative RNA-dependent RNA polymerase [Podospora australis]|uniref:RNA-dependent RNA polymerase n=1 Tax=Podospora australis TaxID=1536484 RepID=A0AAN6X225_9PEZI|nr:putative RNA-dependent RNA polymerase [Podospora australis]